MNAARLLLIRDAQETLTAQVNKSSANNPLLTSFADWLGVIPAENALVAKAVANAGNAKGGERTSRGVALLGFRSARNGKSSAFGQQLEWLIGKPNFDAAGDPSAVLVDPIILLGIAVGLRAVTVPVQLLNRITSWAEEVKADSTKITGLLLWQTELFGAALAKITGGSPPHSETLLWLSAALAEKQIFTIRDDQAADALRQCLENPSSIDDFEAVFRLKALEWARHRILEFDLHAVTIDDVVKVIRNIPQIFQRWTWEDKPRTTKRGAIARKWHIENEYHVQNLLYAILKPLLPSLDEEKYLAPTGTYQPRSDLSVLSLQLVIEVKFWYRNGSVKELTEQVAADHSLYLRSDSPYRSIVTVIWDEGARTEEHSELERGLVGLANMKGVILISKPAGWGSTGGNRASA
jgi:DpnII restriction endonuclease